MTDATSHAPEWYNDDAHLNEAVHEAVAKAVGQALDRGLQLQQTRPERPEEKASGHGTTQAQDERKDARGRRSSSEAPVGRPWTPSMLQATYLFPT